MVEGNVVGDFIFQVGALDLTSYEPKGTIRKVQYSAELLASVKTWTPYFYISIG